MNSTLTPPGTIDLFRVKLVDESCSNNTYQNDDDLFFAIAANEIWRLDAVLYFTNSGAAGGAKCKFTAPAGCTGRGSYYLSDDVSADAGSIVATLGGSGVIGSAAATEFAIKYWLIITNGATAGNITLQWAQYVTDATPTLHKKGSCLRITKLN